ncbi:TonB-linked outer membrane protein, SusC/RagA family [Chitinophaga jiangningensis]|uniref:TonB-linked outer membrane protein, SusC/RagA family n=1 Tax=Chitinophaga jiangningensis TaxID=1419482 RepID=A0A1M7K7T5_9BACT|nr:TonB-dependent receptor [Chitinophaga jiangningensis]SHM61274.1 TonB-linked outer membrane protein, SusC/RagA family [Chitinophaga jiangningensis]
MQLIAYCNGPLRTQPSLPARCKTNHQVRAQATKIQRIMKLTTILLTVFAMHLSATGVSQSVTISCKNMPVPQVLTLIKEQTGYVFFYRTQDLQGVAPVSIQLSGVPVKSALQQVLPKPLHFAVQGNSVVISREMESKPTPLAYVPAPVVPLPDVTGKVTDDKGQPLPGISIQVKGSRKAAITDKEGKFTVKEAGTGAILIVSCIGYETQTISVTSNSNMVVVLKPKAGELDQYVVVGYGSTKRKDLTGSVASVDVNEVKDVPFASLDQALAGKAAGVQVTQADGSPGGVAKIRIRGGTSLIGGNDPLYIIDGVQVTIQNRYIQNQAEVVNPVERFGSDDPNSSVGGSFARGLNSLAGLNISDIESIDILKDASATAIYGSKAANGVIIITTKKGKLDQKPVLDVNYYTGVSKPVKEKLLNADQYRMVMKEAAKNLNDERAAAGLAPNATALSILNNPDFLGTANTDWLNEVMQTGIMHSADIAVRGGGTNSRYYTSLAYTKQNGTVKGTDFNRIAGKISLDNDITRKFRVLTNLDFGFTKNNITNGMYAQALYAPPTLPAYNKDGSVYQFLGANIGASNYEGYQNPLVLLDGINEAKTAVLLGSLSAEYEILPALKFRSILSVNYNNYHQLNYVPSTAVIASPNGVGSSNGGTGSQSQSDDVNLFYENTLTWEKQFNDHHRLTVVGGTSWQKYRFNSFSASGQGFPDDKYLNNLSSAAVTLPATGLSGQNSLLSFYLRANYALFDKYLFTFTGRSDASSKFPENNRVGYFPSGGVAWRISDENFMKRVNWVSELKLRASAGYTGTQNFGDYMFYTLYTPRSYAGSNALVPTQLGNEKIRWESTLQKDLGLDFGLFRNRLKGVFGYYEKLTTGLLLSTSLPPSSSYATVITNLATIRNRGLELDLRGDIIRHKNFQWTSAINISGNRSLVKDITTDFTDPNGDPETAQYYLGNSIVRKNEPLGLIYGKQFAGIIRTQKELDDYKRDFTLAPYFARFLNIGDPMYKLDSTGYYAEDVIGHAQPKFFGGFTNTFSYKNFSLITLLTFSYGGEILYLADIQNSYVGGRTNKGVRILDRWTPENPGSDRPRLIQGENGYYYTASNNVYDASYLKLKSVTLTYTLPSTLAKRMHLSHASAYVSGTNLFCITKYPGPDPEVSNNPYSLINGSSDVGTYPTVRQYTIGLRFGF